MMEPAKFPSRAKSKCRAVCAVKGCSSRQSKDLDVIFHSFPTVKRTVTTVNAFGNRESIDQVKAWKQALKIQSIKPSTKICSLHFKKNDYILPDIPVKCKKLKRNAIPSNNLPGAKKLDSSRETRLINRHKKVEEMMVEQQKEEKEERKEEEGKEDSVPEGLNHHSFIEESILDSKPEETCPKPLILDGEMQVASDILQPTFTTVITNDAELSTLTGIESHTILKTIVDILSCIYRDRFRHNNIKMNLHDKVVMTYMKLKQNFSFSCLSVLFQCYSKKHSQRVFAEMIQILSECLKSFIEWPSKETISHNLPQCFHDFQDVRVVLDCTEISIQSPKTVYYQLINHPNDTKSQTIKFMIGVTPAGNISYISRAYGERTSNKDIFESSDIVNSLQTGDGLMVDKSFAIDDICMKNKWKCYQSPFLREKFQFSKDEAILTCKIAKARMHVERSIQKIKTFKIVGEKMSNNMIPFVEDIFTVICATVNLSSSIIAVKNIYKIT